MDVSDTRRLAKRIGSVPYLNSAPLTYGMESETEFLLPSQLAKRLSGLKAARGPRPAATTAKIEKATVSFCISMFYF